MVLKPLELGRACRPAWSSSIRATADTNTVKHYRNLVRLAVKAVIGAMLISIWFAPQLIERTGAPCGALAAISGRSISVDWPAVLEQPVCVATYWALALR
jgi:hypothetical protein